MKDLYTKFLELSAANENNSTTDLLSKFAEIFKNKIGFATSMSVEDQVILFFIWKLKLPIMVFTIDTGRLPQQTYDLIDATRDRYKINIEIFFPDTTAIEKLTAEKGMNFFYESVDNRKLCCQIRKVEPLKRALTGLDVWITGLRAEQSLTRKTLKKIEWDTANNMIKLNPIIDWTSAQVWEFIKINNIPYNRLHNEGYTSIGCAPCTRAIKPDEDIRSGRWWWESPEFKECGLHNRKIIN